MELPPALPRERAGRMRISADVMTSRQVFTHTTAGFLACPHTVRLPARNMNIVNSGRLNRMRMKGLQQRDCTGFPPVSLIRCGDKDSDNNQE